MEVVKNPARVKDESSMGGSGRYYDASRTVLTFYTTPPSDEITLTDFETLAAERLIVLKAIEAARAIPRALNGVAARDAQLEFASSMRDRAARHGLDNKRHDHISHFILRLAFCRTEELRSWLTKYETELFRLRFESASQNEFDNFFIEAGFTYESQKWEEFNDFERDNIRRAMSFGIPAATDVFYRVPFEEALPLIGKRQVWLTDGEAIVPRSRLVTLVASRFRQHLSKELSATFRAAQGIRQDKRIGPIITTLSKHQTGPAFKAGQFSKLNVTKEQIPSLASRSFPLCMSNLYQGLKADHHLKHGGRQQLGLFLKGIGLPLSEALDFWRSAFARKTPPDKFNKEYAYNLRHNYGKEGKRTAYTPYGCIKIIEGQPGAGDHHGCPFRHFDEGHLRQKLREKKIANGPIDEVMNYVKNKHYQVACQRYFALTHVGGNVDGVGNHPNAYFDASIRHYEKLEGKTSGDAIKVEGIDDLPSSAAAAPSSSGSSDTDSKRSDAPSSSSSSSSSSSTSSSSSNGMSSLRSPAAPSAVPSLSSVASSTSDT